MGKRGYPPKFLKPKIGLVVFRLYDTFAYNAVALDLLIEDGKITEDEAIICQAILISKEAERLSKHQKKFAKVKRGARPNPDTILRLATKEKWTSKGLGLKQLEPYIVFPESEIKVSVPEGTHVLARISPDSISNFSRDRDKHALEIVINDYISRRMNYWNRRLRSEL